MAFDQVKALVPMVVVPILKVSVMVPLFVPPSVLEAATFSTRLPSAEVVPSVLVFSVIPDGSVE